MNPFIDMRQGLSLDEFARMLRILPQDLRPLETGQSLTIPGRVAQALQDNGYLLPYLTIRYQEWLRSQPRLPRPPSSCQARPSARSGQ